MNLIGDWEYDIEKDKFILSEKLQQSLAINEDIFFVEDFMLLFNDQDSCLFSNVIQQAINYGNDFIVELDLESIAPQTLRVVGRIIKDSSGQSLKILGLCQDITLEKEDRVTLHKKAGYYQEAQQLAKLGNWSFDLLKQKIYWSEEMFNIFPEDIEKGEPSLEKHKASIYPEDLPMWEKIVGECLETAIPYEMKFRVMHGESVKWVAARGRGRMDDAGNVVELSGTCQDITNQVLNEKALDEKNKYFEFAVEGANLGIWDWYLSDNSVKFDRRWAEMLGLDYSKIEMKLETWESRVHPDDIARCYEDIKAYMDGKTDAYENVHRMKHADGHWVYILDKGRFSDWDQEGHPLRFTGTHLDISHAKYQELA